MSAIVEALAARIESVDADARLSAENLLAAGEVTLSMWVSARGDEPTTDEREGFRLLALQRQGAKGEPAFNACRETCRELAYHYNLIAGDPAHPDSATRVSMMRFVARHLLLFVSGRMEQAQLGDFCCAARPVRENDASDTVVQAEGGG